jgi:signal transduction histidine kinase/ligand-binding sensor domain-containing protein
MSIGRHRIIVGIVLTVLVVICRPSAFALDPALKVSQYAHTAWKIRDGFSTGTIFAIAQTPDGYLWLGTDVGMLRFDGIRPVPWQPPPGQQLPSNNIRALLVTRDGALWIGTETGLASWKNRTLNRYEPLAGRIVSKLVEDREGSIWAITYFNSKYTLCEIRRGRLECHGDDGGPGVGAISVYEDHNGRLWAGTVGPGNGVWQWKPGAPSFHPLPQQANGIRGLAEDADGALLVALSGALRLVDGKPAAAYRLPDSRLKLEYRNQLRDRDGGLWLGSSGGGLVHFHRGMTDEFSSPDGLSGDVTYQLFEDREGNIWASTNQGLDRFRNVSVTAYSEKEGLAGPVDSVLAARDGSIWVGTYHGLNRLNHGEVTSRWQPAPLGVQSIFQDSLERVWVSTPNDVGYLDGDRLVKLNDVGGGVIRWIAEDVDGNIWIANTSTGLFRLSLRTGALDRTPWDRLHDSPAVAVAADRSLRGVWLGYREGVVEYFADGHVHASYRTAPGLRSLHLDGEGTVWAATDGGLSRVKDSRVGTLTVKNGLPCDGVEWLAEDDDRALWLGMRCGLVRVARPDLADWTTSVDAGHDPKAVIKTAVFDLTDGVRTYIGGLYYSQPAMKSSDGRLWFISPDGLNVIAPRSLAFNNLPPPVHVEQIIADRETYGADALARGDLRLPALTRDLQIDYTALSFVAPEKVAFRYKLEGFDRDWQNAGTRRQAFYTNLGPGNYRFRVIAANNNGVWNEMGATFDFAIAPAYYQTAWFWLFVLVAMVSLVAAGYRFRLRQMATYYNARLDARVAERTRIARDLHDTLLQSFQAVLLKFHAANHLLPDRPEDARRTFESVIEQARNAITEGRDAVQGLRASVLASTDLAEAITRFGDALAAEQPGADVASLRVEVEGKPRKLTAIVQDDIYRILCEALRNAFRHAGASHIEVDLHYGEQQLRARIRDDGKGIDADVLRQGGRPGHHGLQGMHERARLVDGTLTVWSQMDSGTEVELIVPASAAYAKAVVTDHSIG